MVVHCYAGISRSTASAFAAACMLNPHRDEIEIARQIRARSPIASPNRLIVSLADRALGREGRMLRWTKWAGSMTVEGRHFSSIWNSGRFELLADNGAQDCSRLPTWPVDLTHSF